jgi:uncharacterized membrane protein
MKVTEFLGIVLFVAIWIASFVVIVLLSLIAKPIGWLIVSHSSTSAMIASRASTSQPRSVPSLAGEAPVDE